MSERRSNSLGLLGLGVYYMSAPQITHYRVVSCGRASGTLQRSYTYTCIYLDTDQILLWPGPLGLQERSYTSLSAD